MKLKPLIGLLGIFMATQVHALTEVDTELQLLMDVSGSVSSSEYNLQLQGYVDAFYNTEVQSAILDTSEGRLGSIAVQMVMWSGGSQQSVMTDWFHLYDMTSINNFAATLDSLVRPFSGSTAPGSAMAFGGLQFDNNDFTAARQVIDVSGDGIQNNGIDTATVRDQLLASGIDTINGITIGQDYADGVLQSWYMDNIAGGQDAFVINAATFSDFGSALQLKLAAEIEGGVIPEGALPAPIEDIPLLAQFLLGIPLMLAWHYQRRSRSLPRHSAPAEA
ncbi:DUF1194 domain-containing protein [Aeromonas cavernicola]|uniref:VWFA domain-containing protein n=1 Tax=Aeromonas cavernicola TaxID=1006623 RepID=A0A2H9U846_9GAMM|nr:DUF1194 domain-containing protein [Aeromonas cavernicola]PJG60149.1 hypothetical protein CUC53_03370 [Aeromonas cavernicola]